MFNINCSNNKIEDTFLKQERKIAMLVEKLNTLKILREREINNFRRVKILDEKEFTEKLKVHSQDVEKWKSRAVTNAVAKAVSKITRIDKVDLRDPDVVIFVVVLAVNDNFGIKNTDNIPTRRLGLSYATRESKVFTVKSKGIDATNLKHKE